MIVLKADPTLAAVFQKTIKVMEQNVEWNETFAINNNTLVLPGTLKSLFFSFDNKKVIGTVIENEIKEEPRLMLGNQMLENAVNMVLYVFGKWGKIKGLTVEKDYGQLESLMNSILQEIDVQVTVDRNQCRFYKDNVQITYEEVIGHILEYMKPEYLNAQEEQENTAGIKDVSDWEEKYKLGLWHRIVWKSYTFGFVKRGLSREERTKSRIGKDFYVTGYQCPACKALLYMVVYPKGKEFKIETDEGSVVLARAYTCTECHRFYTPKPYKLLLDGSVYMMDFEDDSTAYDDYLELLGQQGERVANSNYNMYENAFLDGSMTDDENADRLAGLYANMPELSDEEIFDIADMFDSGFYSDSEKEQYEDTVETELKKRGINRNIPPKKASRAQEDDTQKRYSVDSEGSDNGGKLQSAGKSGAGKNTENKGKTASGSHTMESAAFKQSAHGGQQEVSQKVIKAADNVRLGNAAAFAAALDTFSEEELKQAKKVLETQKSADTENSQRYEEPLKQVLAGLLKKQQSDVLGMALAAKNKSYQEIRQAYNHIRQKDCPESVKENVLVTVKDWLQKRGEKELQVLTEHLPENYSRKAYQQFRQKFEEYSDIDNKKYIEILNDKRDAAEQKELESFVKKHNKRPKDRKSLLALVEAIKPMEYEEHNKKRFTDALAEQVAALDTAAMERICPDVFDLTFEEGKEAYEKISAGDFLPELKVDFLSRIRKRLEALKKDECRNLVNKLMRDTGWSEQGVSGFYPYDIRRMSKEHCDDTDAIIVNNALNTYAGGETFEYPLLVYDATRGGNGKKGFVLTPDHIYYNSSMTAGTIKTGDAEEFYIESGLFNKGIYVRTVKKQEIKLTGSFRAEKEALEGYLKKLNRFLKYLKEKPESRNVAYLAQEKHDVKCCYRCGYVYQYGNVCPKCGSRNNS